MRAALLRRRRFLSLAGCLAAWPLGAFGQKTATPLIGLLSSFSAALTEKRIPHFARGLGELGYALGREVRLTVRAADNQFARLPRLAAELVDLRVALIATLGQPAVDAARAATSTIPIVFVSALDPVTGGALRSLGRPGGNLTGVTFVAASLGPKRLELLREIAPRGALIAMLANPTSVETRLELKDVQEAAASLQQPLLVLNASNPSEIDAAFAEIARRRASAVLVGVGGFFVQRADQVTELAARQRIPAIHFSAESVAAGGLMSYGASINAAWFQAGIYAGRILRGAKPGDLPVVQPDKFELVLNLKAARAQGLKFPQSLLARADEVIE